MFVLLTVRAGNASEGITMALDIAQYATEEAGELLRRIC